MGLSLSRERILGRRKRKIRGVFLQVWGGFGLNIGAENIVMGFRQKGESKAKEFQHRNRGSSPTMLAS